MDINHNIFGNENLKAEKSDSYNAALSYRIQGASYILSIEPKFFYNRIFDMITLALMENEIYKNVNIGNYETIGSNLSVKYYKEGLSLTGAFSYTGRLNTLYEETGTRKYNYTPEVSLSTDYVLELFKTKISFFYKYTGKMPAFTIVQDEPVEYKIEDFQMLDVSLSRNFFDFLDVVAGVKNAFNVVDINSSMSVSTGAHSSGSSYPIAWGRTFFIRLKFKVS